MRRLLLLRHTSVDDGRGPANAGAACTPATPTMPPVLQRYSPVDAERLKHPADGDWLMVRRTYDGWGYSPLGDITPANVARLQPVWSFSTGVINGHEAPPIVNNGVMFVATPGNQVIAVDAQNRRPALALQAPAAGRRRAAARHQPRRGVVSRQGVFRGRRGGARCARRPDGTRGLDDQGCGEQGGLLHVGGAARRRRQSPRRLLRRRARHPRFRRRVRSGQRQRDLEDLHHPRARRTGQRDLAARAINGRPVAVPCGSRATTIPTRI